MEKEKVTYRPMQPLLLKNIAFESPVKKTPNFLELALGLVFIVFKPFSRIVGFVEFNFKYLFSETNPWAIDEEILVAGLIDEGVVYPTASLYVFIIRPRGSWLGTDSWTFMGRVLFIGNITELATESPQFCFGIVFVKFVLASDLRNTFSWQSSILINTHLE